MLQVTHMLLRGAAGGGIDGGQIVYDGRRTGTSSLSYTFVVPAGVTSISLVAVGAGWASLEARGVSGGALAYLNNIEVTPGQSISINIKDAYVTGYTNSQNGVLVTVGSQYIRVSKGSPDTNYNTPYTNGIPCESSGGNSGGRLFDGLGSYYSGSLNNAGSGGAGGYTGPGGSGRAFSAGNGESGQGGGGGGGAWGSDMPYAPPGGGGGGGVGLKGQGTSGTGGQFFNGQNNNGGGGGSGGSAGAAGWREIFQGYDPYYQEYYTYAFERGGIGGDYGGSCGSSNQRSYTGHSAGKGGVRIIWPGNVRKFPNTLTDDI